jgi:hypothetical protein
MSTDATILGGREIEAARQPGHWLLAGMGKRVLRPGGREMTNWMLEQLAIGPQDRVVEFAPGMGATARLTLAARPQEYIAVERDALAAVRLRAWLAEVGPAAARCLEASAEATGLEAGSCSVVYGEAMLTMQTAEQKQRIVAEAARLLGPHGRYAIHELCLAPDGLDPALQRQIQAELSREIHVGAQPLTGPAWRALLSNAGLRVVAERRSPMHLLEPGRLLRDEGPLGMARLLFNALRRPAARQRVCAMRALFRKYRDHLQAISLIAAA